MRVRDSHQSTEKTLKPSGCVKTRIAVTRSMYSEMILNKQTHYVNSLIQVIDHTFTHSSSTAFNANRARTRSKSRGILPAKLL